MLGLKLIRFSKRGHWYAVQLRAHKFKFDVELIAISLC